MRYCNVKMIVYACVGFKSVEQCQGKCGEENDYLLTLSSMLLYLHLKSTILCLFICVNYCFVFFLLFVCPSACFWVSLCLWTSLVLKMDLFASIHECFTWFSVYTVLLISLLNSCSLISQKSEPLLFLGVSQVLRDRDQAVLQRWNRL